MLAFVHTVEAGNFSLAAARLHQSRSAIAKSVARLEQRLGTRLFQRNTRHHSLTPAGSVFYQQCLRVLAELEQAEQAIQTDQQAVSGHLRISMPTQLGRHCIAPILLPLAQQHPQLTWELSFTDRRTDLIEEGIDLAIRSGALPDNHDYQSRFLGQQRMLLCAHRDYLAAFGTPDTPAALQHHRCLLYGRGRSRAVWRFHTPQGSEQSIEVAARLCMDDLAALCDAAQAGLGIARLPLWLVRPALDAGQLIPVLPDFRCDSFPLQLLWPAARQHTHRLRVVIDALVAQLPARLLGDVSPGARHPG